MWVERPPAPLTAFIHENQSKAQNRRTRDSDAINHLRIIDPVRVFFCLQQLAVSVSASVEIKISAFVFFVGVLSDVLVDDISGAVCVSTCISHLEPKIGFGIRRRKSYSL